MEETRDMNLDGAMMVGSGARSVVWSVIDAIRGRWPDFFLDYVDRNIEFDEGGLLVYRKPQPGSPEDLMKRDDGYRCG